MSLTTGQLRCFLSTDGVWLQDTCYCDDGLIYVSTQQAGLLFHCSFLEVDPRHPADGLTDGLNNWGNKTREEEEVKTRNKR